MTEQNGIDILCDATKSDWLSSPTSTATPPAVPLSLAVSSSSARKGRSSSTSDGIGGGSGGLEPPPRKQLKTSSDETTSSSVASASTKTISVVATTAATSSNHLCHICKRVYERADHLTRHLKSHENARPYCCSRCPKRFNRADLLTRHEATHDRDDGRSRLSSSIRRSDRATQACEACATAKAKCDDQKPCGRCQAKNLVCQSSKRSFQYKTMAMGGGPGDDGSPPSIENSVTATNSISEPAPPPPPPLVAAAAAVAMNSGLAAQQPFPMDAIQPGSDVASMVGVGVDASLPDDPMAFFNPMQNLFQDIDFEMSWDMNFDAFSIPPLDPTYGPSPSQSTVTTATTGTTNNAINARTRTNAAMRDPSRGHAAFKRSPWLWEPKQEDYVRQEKEGLDLDEQSLSLSQSPALSRLLDRPSRKLRINSHQRDRVFSIVLAQSKDPTRVPSFPTLDLLNYLLQAHFVQDDHQLDSWIHAASFDPETTMPELLAAIMSNGATYIAVPSIWKFGLALQEVVRLGMGNAFEANNSNTRNLTALQAFVLYLDVGMWSGVKRKMEIAESFCQPVLTMLRRAGAFSTPPDSPSQMPLASDSPAVVESKWRRFIHRESYKRLLLHLFIYDAQTSVSLQTNPLISFPELAFSLPASRALWRAPNAEAWKEIYLSRQSPTANPRPIPLVSEVMHNLGVLDMLQEHIDVELCYSVLLHGFWGQIHSYRETIKFYGNASNSSNNTTHRLWIQSQHQELYRDLCAFSTIIHTAQARDHTTHLSLVLELFLMVLHVAPDDLQHFAGKAGEEEARRAAAALDSGWVSDSAARHAVWHAGQVFANARRLPPASLRGFNAIALYLASLTLWVYGLLNSAANAQQSRGGVNGDDDGEGGGQGHDANYLQTGPSHLQHLHYHYPYYHHNVASNNNHPHHQQQYSPAQHQQQQQPNQPSDNNNINNNGRAPSRSPSNSTNKIILLDGEETRDTKAFLQVARGVPALATSSGAIEALATYPAVVLSTARDILRDNFPVRSEPLPPLVESLGNLLRDLGSNTGRSSRAVSRMMSRSGSVER